MTLPVFRTPRAKMPVWPTLSGNAVFWLFGLLEAGLWEAWDGVFLFPGSFVIPMLIFSVAQRINTRAPLWLSQGSMTHAGA